MSQASEILRLEHELRHYRKKCAGLRVAVNPGVVAAMQSEIDALRQSTQLKPELERLPETARITARPPANSAGAPNPGPPSRAASSLSLTERLSHEIFEIEKRSDLTTQEKISRITHITCATCAGVAVQPVPFADIFILTPIQAYMGSRIAAIRGVPVSESEASSIIKEILGVIGMGFAAQQIAIGIWKTLIPGAGGFMTIPIVYGLTYAIMRVMDAYFRAKAANRKLTPDEIKSIWKNAKAEGEKHGKVHEAAKKD